MDRPISSHVVPVTVRQFDGTRAVLETADGQTLQWPIKELPDDIAEGTELRLAIMNGNDEQRAQEELARAVLNTLLKP